MLPVRSVFVEKRSGYDVEAERFFHDWKENLGIQGLEKVRLINRYDIRGISENELAQAKSVIFSEPPIDLCYDELPYDCEKDKIFAVEYLPGQYDQRSDSAAQCLQMLTQKERPQVGSAKIVILQGRLTDEEVEKIKHYVINPVESREAPVAGADIREGTTAKSEAVEVIAGFTKMQTADLEIVSRNMGLAMSIADLIFCQRYFRDEEGRDPSVTEIRVIDTYWSDHCRHTTFLTNFSEVRIAQGDFNQPVEKAYSRYLSARENLYGQTADKPQCLMDIAVMGMKELKAKGMLGDLDESEEVNACSIVAKVDVDGREEEWLIMFKNETHNHPTEIEPFGGAATCLGGAIRDPLSGRAYVYQAMRVTGSGDPRLPLAQTLPGKLPQRKITTTAAAGYSSYGNQIGLATGQVAEIYDEGFIAKRMEIGAVIAAVPRANVIREVPKPGDCIVLLGGRTGRDGCGGATGSSKEHTEESLAVCGAEVQKGNPPTERKLQRLFRRAEVAKLIKRCNDFGAGGVSVAIGELAEGLMVELDAVPKKYEGLNGTELAISESQERMAVVVAPENAKRLMALAGEENLEATVVAYVTEEERLKMRWQGKFIVDIAREFLNSNGVRLTAEVAVPVPKESENYFERSVHEGNSIREDWLKVLEDINCCSQKGLAARFDSTVGAATVLMPFGGKYQMTPPEGMAAKVPVASGNTETVTLMTYGYNPLIAKWSPFHGAVYAVVEAVAKIVAMGGDWSTVRLTLQEYFEKLGKVPEKWGKPFAALLGAYYAQRALNIAAIGGKDSMSGTFMELNVPPTLVTFAVNVSKVQQVLSPEFKRSGSQVVLIPLQRERHEMPDFEEMKKNYSRIHSLIQSGCILAAHTVRHGGVAAAVSKMTFGNRIGIQFHGKIDRCTLFSPDYGSILLEMPQAVDIQETFSGINYRLIGRTQTEPVISWQDGGIAIEEAAQVWERPLEKVFPSRAAVPEGKPQEYRFDVKNKNIKTVSAKTAKPGVLIPVFPGTNCEYDSARAFEQAGARPDILVIRNQSPADVEASLAELAARIGRNQIIMLAGGFSAGDEPDGSGKFIATMFRNPRVKEAVNHFLKRQAGIMLGICNGFQALIKLGLVPYGEIVDLTPDCPTLTYNRIGRHISQMVRTKVVSNRSCWFRNVELGEIHTIAVSHGEGRFIANTKMLDQLKRQGQIAAQYVDANGKSTYDSFYNPNGSIEAIEAITSPDGRILGKMGHSERVGENLYKNVPGQKDQKIFAAGVEYFR
jgi:phosphoribosylformylglycinamidine synthase